MTGSLSFANNMNHYHNNSSNNMDHYYNNRNYSIDVPREPILQDTKNPELFNVSMKKELWKYGSFHFISVLGFYFLVSIVGIILNLDSNHIIVINILNIFGKNEHQHGINIFVWIIINLMMPLIFIVKHKSHGFFKQYLLFIGFWLIVIIIPFLHFNIADPSNGFNDNATPITALVFYLLFFAINLTLYFMNKNNGSTLLPINQPMPSNYENAY